MLGKVFGVYRPKSYVGESFRILSSDNLLARLPMQPAQCMATTMHETLTIDTDSDLALIAAGEKITATVDGKTENAALAEKAALAGKAASAGTAKSRAAETRNAMLKAAVATAAAAAAAATEGDEDEEEVSQSGEEDEEEEPADTE